MFASTLAGSVSTTPAPLSDNSSRKCRCLRAEALMLASRYTYGFAWGGSQLFTGRLSDHVGRHWPNVLGMWISGLGVAMVVIGSGVWWWAASAAIAGFGMALLYPNLSAAVADIAPPSWRGSAIGIYRFWRDLGYGIGALGLGLVAHFSGALEATFWFVALSMMVSGLVLWAFGEETHPRINPEDLA
ncbi:MULTISPECIES: MFS transporter [unclassified Shinella]|uniref:MFS transporter n=2 Tax=unclassified Shinella TaxID=2643062 RepID=UPI0030C7D283